MTNAARQVAPVHGKKRVELEARPQTGFLPRHLLTETWRDNPSLGARAVSYLLPWSKRGYPGLRKGIHLTIGITVTWSAVHHWMTGRARLPIWAAEIFLSHIRSKTDAGAALIEDLERYIEATPNQLRHLSPGLRKKTDE